MINRIRFGLRPALYALQALILTSQAAFCGQAEPLLARSNLVAWCIVPFDAKKRGPEERAEMLERLGIKQLAYDYRAEHVPTFDAELEALKRHGIALTAWWFPGELNSEAHLILDVLRRHELTTQLWVTGGGAMTSSPEEQQERVEAETKRLRPIARAAAAQGCQLGLYNHGGWFGEPENQLAIIERFTQEGITNVGIVYNQHHGHEHLDRFAELVSRMKPHLLAFNLNGMSRHGDKQGRKILPLGQGELDLTLLRILVQSGWFGPVGILNHTDEDAETRLLDNLEGLEWLIRRMQGVPAGAKPKPRSWKPPPDGANAAPAQSPSAPPEIQTLEDPAERAALPLYKILPAAPVEELTPARSFLRPERMTNWHRSLGDAASSRFSGLTQINRQNVSRLVVAWTYHSKDGQGNLQCNPIIVDGVMYGPTVGHYIVAVDAQSGVERWRFQPTLPKAGMGLEDLPARRGLLYWPGDDLAVARLVFTCGRSIYALDPASGAVVKEFGQNGTVVLPAGGTVAGAVFQRVLVVPGFNRDVYGYDIVTGDRLWTFHTLPLAGEFGHATWSRVTEGANCWGGMAMDEQRGIAYISTGSPKPNFIGVGHLGENLFANCVVALDALTGNRVWHFQELRHDIWDLDIPAPPNLVTIKHEGRLVDAVAQVTKLGNTLLLDRLSGRPIFPFRLRRAPVSKLPGERTAPYQPDLELPEPFARQVFSAEEVTSRTEEARQYVLGRIASVNFGWLEPFEDGKPTALFGIHGGAEWTGAAFDPTTGCLFISANEIPWIITVFRDDPEPLRDPRHPTRGDQIYQTHCASCHGADRVGVGTAPPLRGLRHRLEEKELHALLDTGRNLMPAAPPMTGSERTALVDFLYLRDQPQVQAMMTTKPRFTHNGYPKLLDHEGYPGSKPPWGTLNCLDLNTGRLRWKVPLGEYPELTAQGLPRTGTENFGGAIVTAGGLVFCAGTRDGKLRAFDKETGAELWAGSLPLGGYATPATYIAEGRQYVVIAATGGGKLGGPTGDAYVAFALPRRAPR